MMICQSVLGLCKCLATPSRKKVGFAGVCAEVDRMFPRVKSIIADERQPEHARVGGFLSGARSRGRAPTRAQVQLRLHAKARLVAEHRQDRFGNAGQVSPQKEHRRCAATANGFGPLCGSPNPHAAPVRWQFNLGKARKKMLRMHPDLVSANQVD